MKTHPTQMRPIKRREAYQVGNSLYRTPSAAAKKLAWSWIFQNYGGLNEIPSLKDIKELHGAKCECSPEDDNESYIYPWSGCEIHDRQYGYFRKLHERTTLAILGAWERQK